MSILSLSGKQITNISFETVYRDGMLWNMCIFKTSDGVEVELDVRESMSIDLDNGVVSFVD